MMSTLRTIACIAVAACIIAPASAAESASKCTKTYTSNLPWSARIRNDGSTVCTAITKYAMCVASAPNDDAAKAAQVELEAAEQEFPDCKIAFKPSIQVVERKLRVVSDDDVEFQRFRRETIGVFELKKGMDTAAATLAKTVTTVEALAKKQLELTKQQPELANSVNALDKKVEESLKKAAASVDTSLKALEVKTETVIKQAQSSQDPLLKEKAYWLDQNRPVLPTNEPAMETRVVGVGFAAYYNPLYRPMFKCVYEVMDAKGKADAKQTIKTDGTVVVGEDPAYKVYTYSIACPSPGYVSKKVTYHLSIVYEDAKGARTIAFQGIKGRNTLMYDMVWWGVKFVNQDVVVDVSGFDPKKSYVCVFTDESNSNIKKQTDSKLLDDDKYKLNCGKQPTGFTIKQTKSRVKLTISVKGTSTSATYAGTGSTLIELPTCSNGVKDGSESDKDCGGLCPKCGPQKTCAKDGDCFNDKCNAKSKKCGGGPGTSQQDPGETCKQIKRDYSSARNGRFWIRGVNNVMSPFKVYCWMADRDGAGWTLGLVNWYQSGGFNSGARGNVDNNVLGRRTHAYKLSDAHIKAVIGQGSTASMFEVMNDQNHYNQYYSSSNREYTLMKDYTAKWFWSAYNAMEESTTNTDFHSYEIRDFDGSTPVGNGKLNWRGRPRCGRATSGQAQSQNAGIKCYQTYGGASGFQRAPKGGTKCKRNLGRWGGEFYWFMSHQNTDTYVYVCNGAQHSSGHSMNHRWWFRSGKNMEK